MERRTEVLIIGAGIAGLTAAKVLKAAGRRIMILEASDVIGGRVRTDEINGFLLDRGFQVLLTAYPEARRFLDYKALDLRIFRPGALILYEKGITAVGDPLRRPASLFSTLFSRVGTFADKLRMLRLKLKLQRKSVADIFAGPETTTLAYLEQQGFSEGMIRQFFRPFMTGIFLESELRTSSRMFAFVFKMFSEGSAAVPAGGMGMIPRQLAEDLSAGELLLNERVTAIEEGQVLTAAGKSYLSDYVLVATDELHLPEPFRRQVARWKTVVSLYFTAESPPFTQPIIALNALKNKLVNNVAVMNQVSPLYGGDSRALISVSVVRDVSHWSDAELQAQVLAELARWYPEALNWRHLKTYRIGYALPDDSQVRNEPETVSLTARCFICGDHLMNGSLNAAMKSGRLAAEAILKAPVK